MLLMQCNNLLLLWTCSCLVLLFSCCCSKNHYHDRRWPFLKLLDIKKPTKRKEAHYIICPMTRKVHRWMWSDADGWIDGMWFDLLIGFFFWIVHKNFVLNSTGSFLLQLLSVQKQGYICIWDDERNKRRKEKPRGASNGGGGWWLSFGSGGGRRNDDWGMLKGDFYYSFLCDVPTNQLMITGFFYFLKCSPVYIFSWLWEI